jgi:hypothetical protein
VIVRALLIWLLLAALAVSAGIAREALLTPRIGAEAAHVVGTFVVVAAFLLAIGLTIGWIVPELAVSRLWLVGGLWLVLTVAFEFGFGHFVAGHSWSRLLRDYDVLAGRIWVLVLLTVLLAPVWLGHLRAGTPP